MEKLLNKYYIATMCYGFLRKAYQLNDATVQKPYPKHQEKTPMLFGDKVMVTFLSTLGTPILFPIHLCRDLNQFHIYSQGLNPKDYTYVEKRKNGDYLFS